MGKTKVKKIKKSKPLGKIDPSLNGKYDNDPFFDRKYEQAKKIAEECNLPQAVYDLMKNR